MFQQYQDRAHFLFVYIQEAHPSDEWQMESNVREGVVFAQPTTLDQRQRAAQQCSGSLGLSMPCVVDDMANTVDNLYAAWPERLFIVDTEGRIAYASKQGPFGFKPEEVRLWLQANLPERAD